MGPSPVGWEAVLLPDGTLCLRRTRSGRANSSGNPVTTLAVLFAFLSPMILVLTAPFRMVPPEWFLPVLAGCFFGGLTVAIVTGILWTLAGQDELILSPTRLVRRLGWFGNMEEQVLTGRLTLEVKTQLCTRRRGAPFLMSTLTVEGNGVRQSIEARTWIYDPTTDGHQAPWDPHRDIERLAEYIGRQTGWAVFVR